MTKTFQETPYVDGWKPFSLTAYLPELERGIWKQTNNHFWKIKIFILSASRRIYCSAIWDRVLSRLRGGLKPIRSFPVHPLPPFAVIQTIITACQCRSWQPGGVWLRRADRVKHLPLHTTNQLRMRGAAGETQWKEMRLCLDVAAVQVGTWEAAALTCSMHSTIAVK